MQQFAVLIMQIMENNFVAEHGELLVRNNEQEGSITFLVYFEE